MANLAAGLRNIVYPIVPQQIVIGGSVADQPGLFPLVAVTLIDALATPEFIRTCRR